MKSLPMEANPAIQQWSWKALPADTRALRDGRRQILSFQYPGDITDLYSYVLKRLDHGVAALTPGMIAKIPHETIQVLREKFPNLAYALWRDTLVDTSKLHSSIMSLGTRTSKERLATLSLSSTSG
jgi:CRP-like cAMP-binding protein